MPKLRDIIYVISGVWLITMGLGTIVDVVKGLRK